MIDDEPHPGDDLLVTSEGYVRLQEEYERLTTVKRHEIAERLRDARESGDLADNLDRLDTLADQAALERRIAVLGSQLARARVVEPADTDGSVAVGTRVRLRDLDDDRTREYEIVGTIEADPANGKLSLEAPVGRALLGRRQAEVVEVDTPRGIGRFEILAVSRSEAAASVASLRRAA